MNRTSIQNATDRLRVLALDADTISGGELRRVSFTESRALTEVLDELHRLHEAVSFQEAKLREHVHSAAQTQLIASKKRAHK